jgi:hypothetical protein
VIDNFRRSKSKFILTTTFKNSGMISDLKGKSSNIGYGYRPINIEFYGLKNAIFEFKETHPSCNNRWMCLYEL